MSDVETALPTAETAAASETEKPVEATTEQPAVEAPQAETKPEKTPEQREIERLRRGIDRRTRQLAEARAKLGLTQGPIAANNQGTADDSEPLSLTRAQIRELVTAEATKLAPTLHEQQTEAQRRKGVLDSLATTFGKERFDDLSSSLDSAFDGLVDGNKNPKPAVEAIFEADDPAKVIEYLADPDNEDEAEAISRMGAGQAGKAIAKLEAKLQAQAAKAKPQASKAAAPLEPLKGQGPVTKTLLDLDGDDFDKRRREQIKSRR